MIKLNKALQAWGHADFATVLKAELTDLGLQHLPLQQGLSTASYALDTNMSVMLLNTTEQPDVLQVKVGVFYSGIIAGCNCADDPTPVDELSEYCEVQLEIDKVTATTTVTLIES